ncbi:MICAL-like protein 2a isoform X2 [Periophthalmus magnuspinnatus]|uniref:MICAL-like protein 2a isoform X2 n=1 Tax=Periophthalmus magnuspinnatus TaxID=409849 RepID=UPI0024369689|nr:MICAL-like protein 2a isoform X2 [Periophthalmus magnuspinnatus]
MAAIKALEQWCKTQCDGYRDVAITNMTTSFRNGMAFCALIHKYRPDLIDFESLKKEDVFENNRLAFQIAEEKLGIPALLDAEDMVALRVPDRLSILTYVSQYYNYFRGQPPSGGVKRPAEGSKEEPSKRNLPVVAKNFVSKKAIENRTPPKHPGQSSPKTPSDGAQKAVLTENANKTGTLNSKCAACKNHVHLVQRHFVEGKLYHRSCFKCSECSSVLHTGGYRPGKEPDSFICKSHQSIQPSGKSGTKTGAGSSAVRQKPPTPPRPSSVLCSPVNSAPKSVSPITPASSASSPSSPSSHSSPSSPPSTSWTTSAQRTQAARQKFFQNPADSSPSNSKPTGPSSFPERVKVPLKSEADQSKVKPAVVRRLAEQNCNNNNKRPFTIRSADRRFGDEPNPSEDFSLRPDLCLQDPSGPRKASLCTAPTNYEPSPNPETLHHNNTSSTSVHSNAKRASGEGQVQIKPVTSDPGIKGATSFPEQLGLPSAAPVSTPASPPKPPSAPAPVLPPVTIPLFIPAPVSPRRHQPASSNQSVKLGNHPAVKSPPRRPAVESISSAAQTNHGNPSGAKKGKYLSDTNAPETETRSPSTCAIRLQQIETELKDIETNLSQLERDGVELEKRLRRCEEEGRGDILMDPLMVDWFNLIREKQMYIRKESELVYIARTLELEEQQPGVEGELRRLLEKPDHLKSCEEQEREQQLMQRLVEIVDGRNAIVDGLDEDRLREFEEDRQLNEMMKSLGLKKAKTKRKSSISKMFRRRSKRRVE